jgi:hypothetical protein
MKIKYIEKGFSAKNLELIEVANKIIEEYRDQGFDLTLRQLYYQMVAKDLIPNQQSEYNRIGTIINYARLTGLLDWDAIVDRTRHIRTKSHWTTPKDIIRTAANQYLEDKWRNQKYRPEVWIEKDALVGVISGICQNYDVPYFSCRGYVSQSAMWRTSQRLKENHQNNQTTLIIHLGDHDPSGIDMTRDIDDRLKLFAGNNHDIKRIALNMNQIDEFNPPPNPTKITDSRAKNYIANFGYDSWELDALEPKIIVDLIRKTIDEIINIDAWKFTEQRISKHKTTLNTIADRYEEIQRLIL